MGKYAAFGIALQRITTEIAGVTNISGPGLSLDTVDVTTHDTANYWEEVVGTILRSGEVSLDIVYDPADATHKYAAAGILHDLVSRAEVAYKLIFPDDAATTWEFNCLVVGFEPTGAVGGALTATARFKVTGQPTLA